MTVRRNHYVPEFYLRMFASSPKRIVVYDKRQPNAREQSIKDTAVERDLYNVVSPSGEVSDQIESELLWPVEDAVAPLLACLVDRVGPLPAGTFKVIGKFIAQLASRVPRTIDMTREFCRIQMVEYQKALASEPDRVRRLRDNYVRDTGDNSMLSVEELTRYLSDPERYLSTSFSRKWAVGLSLMSEDIKMEVLPTLNWAVCRAHGQVRFITSDCPVVALAPVGGGKVIFNAYWYSPHLEVSLPLSPQVCLYLRTSPQQVNRAVSEAFVREINKRTAYAAQRFIFSSVDCGYVEGLAAWAESRRPASWIAKDEARALASQQAVKWLNERGMRPAD